MKTAATATTRAERRPPAVALARRSRCAWAVVAVWACLLPALAACSGPETLDIPVVVPPLGAEIVSLPAEDGFPLAGTLMRDRTSTRGVICLHGWNDNRTSFDPLLPELVRAGFNVLALDMRGNHASIGVPGEQFEARERYVSRDDEWFRRMVVDVQAAKQFLIETCGCDPSRIAVVGAGVGASLAILAAAADLELAALALMSPGWRYLGLDVLPSVPALAGRPMFVTYVPRASGQEESLAFIREALGPRAARLDVLEVPTTYRFGHGTRALRAVAGLPHRLAEWLADAVP